MKILVTGGCGYIGQHVVEACSRAGHVIDIIDRTVTKSSSEPSVCVYHAAIDKSVFSSGTYEVVVHLAADISVAESVQSPEIYYENNVAAGIRLLSISRRAGVKKIVFASSAAVYGPNDGTPIDEEQPRQPSNPYAASKLVLEWALADYARAYGIQVIPLRLFNVAGGAYREDHEPETHLIPNLVDGAIYGRPVTVHRSPRYEVAGLETCERDYVNVRDVARAFLDAVEGSIDLQPGEAINIGSGVATSTREVITAVEKATQRKINVRMATARPGDVATLCADISKARAVLGWTPQRSSLEEIVRDTIKTRSPTV
jgi:UDP-glucose 4-epimerase